MTPKSPCSILDVTEAEADLLLVSLDPLAAMATANADALSPALGLTGWAWRKGGQCRHGLPGLPERN